MFRRLRMPEIVFIIVLSAAFSVLLLITSRANVATINTLRNEYALELFIAYFICMFFLIIGASVFDWIGVQNRLFIIIFNVIFWLAFTFLVLTATIVASGTRP